MLRLRIYIVMFIALCFETILSEGQHDNLFHYDCTSHANARNLQIERFGFNKFHELRKQFCDSVCTSADTTTYFVNLMCAAKCFEYLPHGTTQPPTISTQSPQTVATTKSPQTVETIKPPLTVASTTVSSPSPPIG